MAEAAGPVRTAHLVLVRGDGTLLGRLPPIDLPDPWWSEAASLVAAIRDRDGLDITLLRVLGAEGRPPGGNVTYLAELSGPAPRSVLEPWTGSTAAHPRTPGFACPGGPAADLAWAETAMEASGITLTESPLQSRTWCLSALWRLPTTQGPLWLKVVPEFFAIESRIVSRLAGHPATPPLVAAEGTRVLMREVADDDGLRENRAALAAMATRLVALQAEFAGHADELLALGLPDGRGPATTAAFAAAADRVRGDLPPEDAATVDRFIAGLPGRFAALAECGLPDTLVHGDFHPGNARGTPDSIVLIDLTDAVVGHPLLDMPTFVERFDDPLRSDLRAAWLDAWKRALPGADPERAARLAAPIATARQALVYIALLEAIDPAEQGYFDHAPGHWLARTLEILGNDDAAP